MGNVLAELSAACHAGAAPQDADKLRAGESIWVGGRPVPAEPGHIALSMGDGHSVVVSESSIQEVEKENGLYFVKVPTGTPALVRSEIVTMLRESPCDCGSERTTNVARTTGSGGGGTGPIIIECPLVCRVDSQCSFVLTKTGRLIRVCVPILSCRRECPSQPA